MSFMVSLYSKVYLEEEDASWSARPNGRLLEILHGLNYGQGSARWIAKFGEEQKVRVALGDPVGLVGVTKCVLFVPQWLLHSAGMEGDGDEVEIRFERSEDMPKAARLGFKIIGDIPRDMDIKELLEEPLSQLGVLEEGQMIPAPVLEGVCLLVHTCERADGSIEGPAFLDGADIALEIEEDAPIETPPVAAAATASESSFESDMNEMLPFAFPSPSAHSSAPPLVNRGFIPFQGVGRRLCD